MQEKPKKKAKSYANEAKESASEFADDAKEVLSDGKNVAIIAHLTLIGWIIALVMNSSAKTELGSYYIRQVLGIGLLGLIVSLIPMIKFVGWIVILVLWVMSLISALSGEKKPIFLLGTQFQDWFKAL